MTPRGPDLTCPDLAPLIKAIAKRQLRTVRRLLVERADLVESQPECATFLLSLAIGGLPGIAAHDWISTLADAKQAIESGREIVDLLIDRVPLDYPAEVEGETPLMAAAQLTHPLLVEELLARGANREARCMGATALSNAIALRDRMPAPQRARVQPIIDALTAAGR